MIDMGQKIPADSLPASALKAMGFAPNRVDPETSLVLRVYDEGDRFLGIGELTTLSAERDASAPDIPASILRPRMVFRPVSGG